ncbi:MAG: hypothetical protein FIA82_01275 [Melioribacter sp.]|nr:hypothetical protein [Melioribacter sp.]
MKLRIIFILFVSLTFLSSCSLFNKDSFEGKWELKLNGDLTEVFEFDISANNDFSFSKDVFFQGNSYGVTIKGNVSKEGKLFADLFALGQKMGIVEGTLTYDNGTGKWDASYARGNWSAVKK